MTKFYHKLREVGINTSYTFRYFELNIQPVYCPFKVIVFVHMFEVRNAVIAKSNRHFVFDASVIIARVRLRNDVWPLNKPPWLKTLYDSTPWRSFPWFPTPSFSIRHPFPPVSLDFPTPFPDFAAPQSPVSQPPFLRCRPRPTFIVPFYGLFLAASIQSLA